MKTEKEIRESIEKVKLSMGREMSTLRSQIDSSNWGDAEDTLFTLIANVCALEAAERILS